MNKAERSQAFYLVISQDDLFQGYVQELEIDKLFHVSWQLPESISVGEP